MRKGWIAPLIGLWAGCGGGDNAAGGGPAVTVLADLGADPRAGDLGPATELTDVEVIDGRSGLGTPLIDANPDEGGNLWMVTPTALYIREAGQSTLRRYTNEDGLHIYTVITAVAGAGPGEGYVGLEGHETDYPDADPPAFKAVGRAEHVHLLLGGAIRSKQYDDLHTDASANYWETRSARRLLYAHDGPAAGHLFLGGNHGITHIFDDTWGDHVHVEIYYLPERSGTYGDWFGLALDPTSPGALWTCGKMGCGMQTWNADPRAWVLAERYRYAFTVFTADHGLEVPHGYREDFVATAVTRDGTAYFLSRTMGLAAWQPANFDYQNIRRVPVRGLGAPVDMVADPDGTLWLADDNRLVRFNPATNDAAALSLPTGGDVRRLYLDARATPRALYISTGAGLLIYRGK